MAGEDGAAADALRIPEELRSAPWRFDFYQALRRLECLNRDKPRIGRSLRPADDPVRLGQEPSLGFAPSTIASLAVREGDAPPRLEILFFGLLGPNGPLPLHLTEFARDRLRNAGDPTFARFLDMFHHRMISLFYDAWASAQPAVCYDRPESDRFARYTGALFGLGMPSLRDRDEIPDLTKLHFAGQLACQTRHADGLESMLSGFFGLPVSVERFVGQWLELPEEFRCFVGSAEGISTLGRSVTVGSRTWECQGKFRVVFGPLEYAEYQELLPGTESLGRLIALIRNYTGDELDWDMQLILKKEEVPALRLGGEERLGWTSWLAGGPRATDASDLTLDPLP